MDLDWLWDELARREPLNVGGLVACGTEFVIAATSVTTGRPVYVRPEAHTVFDALKGSCALPLLYRRTISVDGEPIVDGGVADPLPVEEAYRLGARRIVVVRSRPPRFVKKAGLESRFLPLFFRGRQALVDAIRSSHARYRRSVAFMHAPPGDCTVVQIAPPEPLRTKRTSRDPDALAQDYRLGRQFGADFVDRWGREKT